MLRLYVHFWCHLLFTKVLFVPAKRRNESYSWIMQEFVYCDFSQCNIFLNWGNFVLSMLRGRTMDAFLILSSCGWSNHGIPNNDQKYHRNKEIDSHYCKNCTAMNLTTWIEEASNEHHTIVQLCFISKCIKKNSSAFWIDLPRNHKKLDGWIWFSKCLVCYFYCVNSLNKWSRNLLNMDLTLKWDRLFCPQEFINHSEECSVVTAFQKNYQQSFVTTTKKILKSNRSLVPFLEYLFIFAFECQSKQR